MAPIVKKTARMKHALTCCDAAVPTLNQTGELELNIRWISAYWSSWSKISASSSVAKLSSRRRHTISPGDWSSDVCSSDLQRAQADRSIVRRHHADQAERQPGRQLGA